MCEFDNKNTLEMLAPLISCLLQSISLNELFNQIGFPHEIEITLCVREQLQPIAEQSPGNRNGRKGSENTQKEAQRRGGLLNSPHPNFFP